MFQCDYCHRNDEVWLRKKATMPKVSKLRHDLWLRSFQKTMKTLIKTGYLISEITTGLKSLHSNLIQIQQNLPLVAVGARAIEKMNPGDAEKEGINILDLYEMTMNIFLHFITLQKTSLILMETLMKVVDQVSAIQDTINYPIEMPLTIGDLRSVMGFDDQLENQEVNREISFLKKLLIKYSTFYFHDGEHRCRQ